MSGPLSDRLGVKFILAQGVLVGIACGMIFTPVVSTVGQYFTTRRALAMGIVVGGAAISGIIFPITLNRLLNTNRIGFGWAVLCPNPSDIGTYVGQGLAVCSFGALAGTPINGALIRQYGYLPASMFSGAALIVGMICHISARLLLDKRLFVVRFSGTFMAKNGDLAVVIVGAVDIADTLVI
ncbi:hypothetical protein UA08_08994 [Talaromyces atroroseus]|uniref:Major facilitator superfamily (MFS) profile domain-containing protein n=1 Tax=Talaromyces atroroseus TaxID=1441469 RepID=A0A1Q5Q773_TALAT|nr:hypothetical protein UA08_08994 [Talaromyces atroroseus]OKL55696.1 hypothetical protein UA08_08994 [Talaromyces atroroseus]